MPKAWKSNKDPDENIDFDINWAARLVDGETISSSTWTLVSGDVVLGASSNTTTRTKIWVTGGTLGTSSELLNRIVTSGGRTMDQTGLMRIRAK